MSNKTTFLFNGVCVADSGDAYVSSSVEELNEQQVDNLVIHHYGAEGWRRGFSAAHACGGTVARPGGVLAAAIDGQVFQFPQPGADTRFVFTQGEVVDASSNGFSDLVHLKAMRLIGQAIYCAGFARRVYRRGPGRSWQAVDQGVFVPREQRTTPIGFLAIGGASEQAIYAAGIGGEIWSCQAGQWQQESSPTNVALTTMASQPNGAVCIGGLVGVLIQGSANHWRVIEQTATTQPFWGATYFKGRVYVATNEGVFALNDEGDDIEMVYDGSQQRSASYLDASETAMWSVGDKGIAWTDDGRRWQSVPQNMPA